MRANGPPQKPDCMTLASTHTPAEPYAAPGLSAPAVGNLWMLIGLSVLASLFIALPNLADPMIRHDDYPAFFADADMFWAKTLHEGRWLNWVWHLREVVTPAWLNFAIYQVFWAIFAACLAFVAMQGRISGYIALALAVLILVAPPARVISLWFNTLIPGIALLALYAFLATTVSQRMLRALLLPFTVISFMAYTTYPVLLLAVCLARTERRSFKDLILLLAWFTLCFGTAVLTVYALNLQVHGVFGVPLDDWRNADPAGDFAGLMSNLPVLGETLVFLADRMGFSHPVLQTPSVVFFGFLFLAATGVLIRHAPLEAVYLHAGLWTGMALMVLQSLKLGVIVPPRAFIFVWVFFALLLVRATCVLIGQKGSAGRWMRNGLVIVLGAQVVSSLDFYTDFRSWQAETRAMAAHLAPGDTPILVTGNIRDTPIAERAALQDELAFRFRMQMLTGRNAVFCDSDPKACAEWENMPNRPELNLLTIKGSGEDVVVRLTRSPALR